LSSVTIRETHERPEGMDEGILMMSGMSIENILLSIKIMISQKKNKLKPSREVSDYKDIDVSSKILKIVLSYIEYINRTVWQK
jgi:UDP-N-acetylglucosamine 2-epimerase (non-hydrolysing)